MGSLNRRILGIAFGCFLLTALLSAAAFGQNPNCPTGSGEICSVPATQAFANTYVGKASGNKVLTIYNNVSATITIESIGFSCTTGSPTDWGIASGTVPFQMGIVQTLTHYSIFFQPHTAMAESCNFVVTMQDGFVLNVPLTGTGLSGGGVSSLSKTSLTFANQQVGTTSTAQTVTITNTGTSSITLNAITLAPPSFTTSAVTLPATIKANNTLTFSVFYTPSQVTSENGVLDLTYTEVPDNGITLTGNGTAASSLAISNSPTLPQATQGYAYQANLAASGGTSPYTFSLASGSSLPSGLTLSSAGVISGTLASSVATGNYNFTVQVTDHNSATASTTFTLGVFAYLGNGNGESCNTISFNDPILGTPVVALTDLGTGFYQGNTASGEGGLYPNGSNVRPASHDSDGKAFADAIQPLDANGNPDPTGKYVLMAIGESTAQNEFNRFLPMANADPAKNPSLVIVNGAQGGATPNNFTSTTSAYWTTVLQNYLPQNGVTAQQVVAIWMEDTDGIATGMFPSDISTLQSEYETMMQTMLTLFPNLKLVYFSSRVYAGYSNGVTTPPPPNPEPWAYEVGFAVKGAITDQLNGNANLNYDSKKGAVVAPWMSWGPYYWSNGMLGRSDGLVWDCEDFSSDGTHPSTSYGQLKVASKLFQFVKTDDTTIPWYLTPNLTLMPTAGNNQTGNPGTTLPSVLTVEAENLNSGVPQSGVAVTFNDGGAGGTFGTPSGNTGSDGTISTTYTLPATGQTVSITASASKYASGIFTETAVAQVLSTTAGNNQSGTAGSTLPIALVVTATSNGTPTAGVSVTFNDAGAGGTFGTPTAITGSDGTASTTYTLPSTAKTVTITASAAGYSSATFTETSTAASKVLTASAGNNQTGGVGTTLPIALQVTATSNGTAKSGVSVSFSDGGAGGTFGTPRGTTGSNGTFSSTYTLPSTAKTVTITATASAYTSATFTETATASSVTSITLVSGGKQSGTVGTTLPLPIVMKAKNSSGQGVAGVSITFSDAAAGGSFNPNPAITGSTGQASTSYTLPTKPKNISITASSGSISGKTTETSVAGSPSLLNIVSGNNQTGFHGKPLTRALVVSVTDQYKNGIAGVTVNFTDNGAGGTFSATSVTTSSSGQASVTYTAGPNPGTVTISASTSTLGPANFTETIR